jgi:hypothetical protein
LDTSQGTQFNVIPEGMSEVSEILESIRTVQSNISSYLNSAADDLTDYSAQFPIDAAAKIDEIDAQLTLLEPARAAARSSLMPATTTPAGFSANPSPGVSNKFMRGDARFEFQDDIMTLADLNDVTMDDSLIPVMQCSSGTPNMSVQHCTEYNFGGLILIYVTMQFTKNDATILNEISGIVRGNASQGRTPLLISYTGINQELQAHVDNATRSIVVRTLTFALSSSEGDFDLSSLDSSVKNIMITGIYEL